jgi:hypothetical protein
MSRIERSEAIEKSGKNGEAGSESDRNYIKVKRRNPEMGGPQVERI